MNTVTVDINYVPPSGLVVKLRLSKILDGSLGSLRVI